MVNENIIIKDKWRSVKKVLIIFIIIFVIFGILASVFFSGFLMRPRTEITLENPLKEIIFTNTNEAGEVNYNAVLQQGTLNFNEDYINYILVVLGVNNLHKSLIGYGNPVVELVLDDETWSSEIIKGALNTQKTSNENKDLRIIIPKQEAVKALLSPNIKQFMKDSVYSGNTKIEMIAEKVELGSKGYLSMYKALTGEEIEG